MKTNFKRLIIVFALIVANVLSALSQTKPMNEMWGESAVAVDALRAGRGKLFDEGNFGMFIHWGLFSHLGGIRQGKTYYGIGEWIMSNPVPRLC